MTRTKLKYSGENATAFVNRTGPEMVYSSTNLLVIKHKLYVATKRCMYTGSFIEHTYYNFTFYFMWL